MRTIRYALVTAFFLQLLNQEANADVLCQIKKTGAIVSRTQCKKKEIEVDALSLTKDTSSASAGTNTVASVTLNNNGALSSGSDFNTGLDVNVNRTSASGGTLNTKGVSIDVVGDGGGDSTNVGLSVTTSGADTNYSALFNGGNVGIGVSDPDELLQLNGRLHLGQVSAPSTATDKLYNVGGDLYWNGQKVGVGTSSGGGTITSVTAGTGLSGGGTSGAVTLSIDAGTGANKIVQLNSSGELPAVSGANVTALSASNISTGTITDSRLSSNVSLLGSSISLSGEVSGVLPITSGGTGVSSLSDFIALGTNTSGNYVASVSSSGGITGGASGSEGATLALSIDQSFAPSWSGTHSFLSSANFGTSLTSSEALHLNGRLHLEQAAAPSTTTDKLYNVGGALFFNGQNLSTGAAGGDITSVVAGTGLSGGGTSGDVTLTVDSGITANKIVKLNASAELPAVSGANLTVLNATTLTTGTVPDGALSSNVSKLGTSISLATEVTGTLPVGSGGTGAASLTDLIALGTHTTGNYVSSVSAGTGISVSLPVAEGGTASVSLDQSVAPTWTSTHTFSGVTTDIATLANENFAIMPNGTGKVGIGTTNPTALLTSSLTSTSTTAATETGARIAVSDSGVVPSGTDATQGLDVSVTHTGASGGTITTGGVSVTVTGDTGGNSTATGLSVSASGADTNYAALFTSGFVGVGTSTPTTNLDVLFSSASGTAASEVGSKFTFTDTGTVSTSTDTSIGMQLGVTRTGASGGTINTTGLDVTVTGDSGGTSKAVGLNVTVGSADTNIAATFSGGSVGVGDTVSVASSNVPSGSVVVGNGIVCVDNSGDNCDDSTRTAGTIYANNATVTAVDLAEDFPIVDGDVVEAGDIVKIDTHRADKCVAFGSDANGQKNCTQFEQGNVPFVTRSTAANNGKRILGVVSTKPGITLGGFGQEELINYRKVPVALAGRVPLKVTLENGEIEIGDRITASNTPGAGMLAKAGDTVIGIALEGLSAAEQGDAGVSRILVLVK